ncbi:hypothetical protein KPA96_34880, partial [Burkholderia cenocepacia]|uniref:hypothetical protein n=1 Tax=Burkholderia cenocepacia TaxID=95486 RepID=UPI00285A558C
MNGLLHSTIFHEAVADLVGKPICVAIRKKIQNRSLHNAILNCRNTNQPILSWRLRNEVWSEIGKLERFAVQIASQSIETG